MDFDTIPPRGDERSDRTWCWSRLAAARGTDRRAGPGLPREDRDSDAWCWLAQRLMPPTHRHVPRMWLANSPQVHPVWGRLYEEAPDTRTEPTSRWDKGQDQEAGHPACD